MTTDARLSPLAGKPAPANLLVDLPKLITAYYTERPDPGIASQRVAFGTSGHRGISFERSFNEAHVLAITQAICEYRKQQGINGPLFLGFDTHALSAPAFASALEVLAANDVEVMIAKGDEYTPTPAISHAILVYNSGRTERARRRHRHHALAQSTRQRRLQIQPHQRRSGGYADHRRGSKPRRTACWQRTWAA